MTNQGELSKEEFNELSPADREQYLQEQAAAGVDSDSWLVGPIQQMVARMQASGRADEMGQQNISSSTTGETEYVQGLQPSDADYQGFDHPQLQSFVTTNLSPEQVTQVSDAYNELRVAFEDFAEQLNQAMQKSKSEWEGPAAESARGYFGGLTKWADANAQNSQLASETVYQQSEAATTAKNSMPEPIPFNWDTEMQKWGENPLDLTGNISESFETYKASNDAHQEAAGVLAKYDGDLYSAASKQPVFGEPPKFGVGGSGGGPGMNATGELGMSSAGTGTSPSGFSGGGGGGPIPGGGGGPISIPGGGGSGGSGGGGSTGPVPSPLPGRSTGSQVPAANYGTNPQGYQSPRVPPSTAGGGRSGFGGMGAMPMGGAGALGGMGGGQQYSGKLGRGGFGPTGSGGGATGSGPATGSGTGGAKPGAAGASETLTGKGSGSSGGRGAPMGAGRGGQRDEDETHERPEYLVEGDPDEVFGTDQKTAPPVIGE